MSDDDDATQRLPGEIGSERRGSRRIFDAVRDRVAHPRAKRLVSETYGVGPRGGPDTAAAAADLGVSRRTVQRWIQKGLPKGSPHGSELQQKWENSPAGRRASISPSRVRSYPYGANFQVRARIWVSGDRRNGTPRAYSDVLTAVEMEEILEAVRAGDDERAHGVLESHRGFGGSVQLDLIDIRFDPRDRP